MASPFTKLTDRFIPRSLLNLFRNQYSKYYVNFTNQKEAVYIDISDAWKVYCTIPHLNLVINKKAEMLSNGVVSIVNADGEQVENVDDYLTFLKNPNVLQSYKEWISQLSIYEDLYGNGFIYPLVGTSMQVIPSAMWNLPSGDMIINKTGKIWDQTTIEGIIESYELEQSNGANRIFAPDEVVHTNNNDNPAYIKGTSKLEPIQKNLTNIDAVLKTANVLYSERGGLFMFSHDGRSEMGSIPLNKEEKKEIEKKYRQDYGVHEGQQRNIITSSSLKATPISFPIKDLMMFEELESDFAAIISMYGMDRDLFPSTKGATFENKLQAQKITYQDTIIPNANDKADMLTKILKLEQRNLKVKIDFSHLPVFQENEVEKAKVQNLKSDSIRLLVQAGMSIEQAEEYLMITE